MMTTDTKEQSNNAAALAKPLLPPPNEEPVVAFASEEDIEQGAYLLQKESILDTGNAIEIANSSHTRLSYVLIQSLWIRS
jgi:hypothetical protein